VSTDRHCCTLISRSAVDHRSKLRLNMGPVKFGIERQVETYAVLLPAVFSYDNPWIGAFARTKMRNRCYDISHQADQNTPNLMSLDIEESEGGRLVESIDE
jgi:hypothetical protein